jgi:hypothetical protein
MRTKTGSAPFNAYLSDLRRGFTGLSALVQTKLEQTPFSEHVFVFRGRRANYGPIGTVGADDSDGTAGGSRTELCCPPAVGDAKAIAVR